MAAGQDRWIGAIGMPLDEATRRSFFVTFGLQLYEPATALGNGVTWHGFRPRADIAGRGSGATLNLETDAAGRVVRATLCLDHAWIAGAETRLAARRMSGNFLRWALSQEDGALIDELVAEIEEARRDGGGAAAGLPQFPSAGYRSFLGYQEAFEQELADCHLKIANRNWHRRDAASAAPPGYDSETRWLWITVRRWQPLP